MALSVVQQIAAGARARGLDPQAVLAVARVEGLGGGVGDQGTSFGPFQLHKGGALPRGIANPQQWASSPRGIGYALDQIAKIARGLQGRQAVSSIVTRFERPANPGAEIQKAQGLYGQQFGGGPATPPSVGVRPLPGFATAPDLTGSEQSLMGLATQAHPDYQPLFQQLQAAQQTPWTGNVTARQPHLPSPFAGAAAATRAAGGQINELLLEGTGGPTHSTGPHVHAAMKTLQAQLAVEAKARQLGLNVGQNTDMNTANSVHAPNSYHKRDFPGSTHRMAADISGSTAAMNALYRWIKSHYG